jgi:uncharacterized membrane-anchored protein YitT (DUF2179 family)
MKMLKHLQYNLHDILYTIFGAFIAGFALKGFMVPNNFVDGGVTGISLLLHEAYGLNLAIVLVLANLPLIIMGGFSINKRFAFKTTACVLLLSLFVTFVPYPEITHDKLLISVFGGFFMGLGIGLAMRGGCAMDGIEVLALYTGRKSSFTITEIIFAMNCILFLIYAMKFGPQSSLYSMLTYFAASKTIDYVVEGLEAYTGVTIISGKSEEIKKKLVMELGRGITVYKGERGFMKDSFNFSQDCDIVFTVITRLELRKLKNLVHGIDHNAFLFTSTIKEAAGGVLKRRAGGHHEHH